jgi:hypothetical protein
MTRPIVPRSWRPGPRLPQFVLRRRPAEVVFERPPAEVEAAPACTGAAVVKHATTAPAVPRETTTQAPAVPLEAGAPEPAAPRQRGRRVPTSLSTPSLSAPSRPAPPRLRTRAVPAPRPVRRRRIPVALLAAALVFAGLFAVGLGLGAANGFDLSDFFHGPDEPPPRAFPVLEPSKPVSLSIPAIKVSAPIMQVGLANDGSVDVPPLQRHNEAGWFDEGPTPGQFGPAIIVGHADTKTGPSVFHDLKNLKPGQKISVRRKDDSIAIFEINSVEHFGKTKLPVKRVYGDYSRPQLRLMTCGGTWLGSSKGYEDNYVVFASLVSSGKA